MRLLIVAIDVSHPPCDGVSTYVAATVELLHQSGFDVVTLAFTNKQFAADDGEGSLRIVHSLKSPRGGVAQAAARLVRSVWSGLPRAQDHLRSLRTTVEKHVRDSNFDVLIALGNSSAELVRRCATPRVVVQFSPPTTDSLLGAGGWPSRFQATRWQRRIGASATVLAATTPVDAATIGGIVNRDVRVLPLSMQRTGAPPATRRTPAVLFIGDFGYPPNALGADVLIHQVMPRVWRELPDLELVIAGDKSDALPDPHDARVTRYGRYEAVGDLTTEGTVAVLPILAAAGIRTRVFELAAAGLPLVVTPEAVEGLGVEPGEFIVVSIDTMSDAIIHLVRNDELRQSVREGSDAFLARFQPDTVAELWLAAIGSATGHRRPGDSR